MGENYITIPENKGTINISEDVIVSMVKNSLADIEGFAGLASTTGAELAEWAGIKTAPKGIKVQMIDGKLVVNVIVLIKYGANLLKTAEKIQDAVTLAVEAATGFNEAVVNVLVSGITFEK